MRASLGRDPWQDRFSTPTVDVLLAAIAQPQRALVEAARTGLLGLGDVTEHCAWRGLPWRWAMSYAVGGAEPTVGFVVPRPDKPTLAMPLDAITLRELPLRRLSKGVRETLAHAPSVGGVLWPEWELTSPNQVGELLELTRRRIDLARPAAAAG